jgi:hypothetical protein
MIIKRAALNSLLGFTLAFNVFTPNRAEADGRASTRFGPRCSATKQAVLGSSPVALAKPPASVHMRPVVARTPARGVRRMCVLPRSTSLNSLRMSDRPPDYTSRTATDPIRGARRHEFQRESPRCGIATDTPSASAVQERRARNRARRRQPHPRLQRGIVDPCRRA